MPNYNVTNNIDTLLRSTSNAAARTSLELGDAATKNTGTTAGTVAAGDDSRITGAVQTSGGTMTGKLTAAADNTIAKLSVGARTTGSSPTALADGDIWISNQGALSYRDSTGPTSRAVASLSLKQIFNAPQTVSGTMNADPALTVSNTGIREVVTISNTAAATSDAVVITNLGSGNSLVVNDETTPDSTRFAVANNGRVGIGVAPDAAVALSVDASGIKFSDGSVQTTASGGGVAGVSSFSAGTTGLSPATGTTGAVTLGGTLGVANGGTGQTTANAAINALLPSQTGNSGKILSTDGTNTSWATAFKFSNTKIVGVDAATIQGCIDLVSSPTALTQVQVLIPPGVYNENLTLKPCVSLASTGLNNGQSSIVRINGTHTLTGGTIAGDNIIQLNGLRMDYNASTSPTLTISATGTTPLLVHMQDCMIGNSNASTSSVGVLVNQYCSLRCNNVKSLANSTSGSGGTHIEVNGGTFYGDQFSTEYGTLALRLSGTGGALKPYAELKQCSLSCVGSNVVDITSTTALFSAGWTSFANTATTGNGINIATGSVIGVFNSVFVITAGASNYVVTGGAGGVYYSLNNSYSNSTGVPYETKVNANISQFLYSSSIPSALTALTGDVTASGTGSQAATVARIQGRNVLSTAPTNGQVLAWNGTAWAPAAAAAAGVSSFSAGTTGLSPSTASTGAVTLAGTLAIANGGTGQTTQQAAINALAGATTSGQYLRGNGTNVTLSAIQAADVPTLNQNTTGTAGNVTGTVAIANGGTGQTTANSALNALLPSQASNSGKVLSTDGTNTSWITAGGGSGTVTSVDVSGGATGLTTSGGPVTSSGTITLAGTLALANGGTGATTQSGAANAVLPSQATNSGKFLTTDGSNVSWATAGGGGGLTTQVDRYLTTQNVTVPAGAKKLDVFCVGAGGSGGGGSGGNGTLANRGGGGGGGGGGFSTASFNATNLPASIQVVVGAAGAAGNGGVGLNDGTSAGVSGRSGITTIGSDIATFPSLIVAFSGNAGSGGSTTGTSGAAASGATSALFAGTNGGTGGSSGGAGSAGSAQNASAGARAATGGGGGGAISTSTFANGGAGGNLVLQSFGGGGAAGTTNGANGGNGWTALYDGQVASGGGGAAGSSTNTGGTGGAGGFPGGGGGGGGAGLNNGGSGGVGGAGIVVLTWYF